MNEDVKRYILEILIRARDETRQAAQRAADAIGKVTQAQREGNVEQAKAIDHEKAHASSLQRLVEAHTREKKAGKETADAIRQLAQERRKELEQVKLQIEQLNQKIRAERASANERRGQHTQEIAQLRAESEERSKAVDAIHQQIRQEQAQATERKRQHVEEITQLRAQAAERERDMGRVDRIVREQRREAAVLQTSSAAEAAASERRVSQLAGEAAALRTRSEEVKRGASTLQSSANVEASSHQRTVSELSKEIAARRTHSEVLRREATDLDQMAHRAESNQTGLRRFFSSLRGGADDANVSLAKLGASLHGFQIAFAIKYAQALVSALVALGATLVSVASSALQAGAALAGALAAGAAQALPVIGVLAGTFVRLAAVMKAVNLQNQQQLLTTRNSAQEAERQRAGAERIINAQQAVEDANRRVTEATQALTDARKKARSEVEALILAELRAKDAAMGATLSLEQAQINLRRLVESGAGAGQVAQAQIDVSSARTDVRSTRGDLQKATTDVRFAQRTGMSPAGAQQVAAAERQVADAQRQAARSAHDLAAARKEVAYQTGRDTAANDRLQAMLALMTPAERGLYRSILRIQQTFRTQVRPITDILVRAFATGVDRANKLLQSPQILRGFERVTRAIKQTFNDVLNAGTGRRSQNFFTFLTLEIQRNGPLITRILTGLFDVFQNLARAGAPAFREILRFAVQLVGELQATTSHAGRMRDFFLQGVGHLKAWVRLAQAAFSLLASIAGSGASSGLHFIQDITQRLNDLAQKVRDNRQEVSRFFEDSRRAVGQVIRVVVALAKAIINSFSPTNVKTFADFMVNVLIPALANVIQVMGYLTSAVHALLSLPFISDITQWIFSVAILMRGLMILKGALSAVGLALGFVRKEGKLLFIGNPWLLAISGVITALLILDTKFGIIKSFFGLFKSASDKAREAADKLTGAINRQIDALRRQRDAELGRQNAQLGVERASIATVRARQELARVTHQIATGELKGKDADLALREAKVGLKQAILDEKQARVDLKSSRDTEHKSDRDAINASSKAIDAVRGRVDALKDEHKALIDRRGEIVKAIKGEEDFLRKAVPGTLDYKRVQDNLKKSKQDLGKVDDALRGNEQNLRSETNRGIDSLKQWRSAIKRAGGSTADFGSTVGQTMDSIVSDVNQVLTEFGARPIHYHAKRIQRRQQQDLQQFQSDLGIPNIGGFRQRGGMVPGSGDGDRALIMAEPGEGFINKRAVSALGGPSVIDAINRMIPRFQRGGIVPIPGQAGKSIDRRILGDVLGLIRKYKAQVTAGYAPTGHAAGGEHPLGLAVDLVPGAGGSWNLIDALANWAEPQQNHPRYPFRWVGYTGDAGHGRGNHLHLSWLHNGLKTVSTLHGQIGAMLQIARRIAVGPPGSLRDLLQGTANRGTRAANRYLGRALASIGNYSVMPSGADVAGSGAGLMRTISRQRGWSFPDWWAVDAMETSHGQNLSNPTSSARLRGQFLNFNWGKYGPGSDPRQNPTMAQQIRAMAAYIEARYRSPTAALAFHKTHGWYRHGGAVPGYGGGDRWPILAEGGEHVFSKEEVQAAGGHNVLRSVRQMLGGGGQGGDGKYQTGGRVGRRGGAAFGSGMFGLPGVVLEPNVVGNELIRILQIFSELGRSARRSRGAAARLRQAFALVFDDGGLLTQLSNRVQQITDRSVRRLQEEQFKIGRGGVGRRTTLSPADIARQELGALGDERGILYQQRRALTVGLSRARQALRLARRRGDQRAAQQARSEINRIVTLQEQLRSTLAQSAQDIVEKQESVQQAVVDQITSDAQKGLAAQALRIRVAGIGGTDYATVGDALVQQGKILSRQRDSLAGLLSGAQASGNVALVDTLTASIGDLDASIKENTQAVQDNTDAAFNAGVDKINNAFGFSSSVFSSAIQFFQGLSTATGTNTSGIITSLLGATGDALGTQRTGLTGKLGDLLGYTGGEKSNLQGLSGPDLVNYLLSISSGPAFDSIMGRLDPAQQEAFKGLIQALIGNTIATQDNTQQLGQASTTQSFTSSWWTRFRMAIFTGGGDLLPQYQMGAPIMDDGRGVAARDGMYFLRMGERVTLPGGAGAGDVINLNVTHPVSEFDPHLAGQQLAFAKRTRGR